ncbi:MAG: hypothetical protein ABJC89_10910 [Acidobacteriota bacterium]
MLRILRAFAWLRWRMLINSLEQTGARDTLERFSLAIEKLGPIMAGILIIPAGLGLAVMGVAAGYGLTQSGRPRIFEVARFVLISVPVLAIVGPLLLPAGDRTNPVRMLLLPISRSTLYVAQSVSVFGDFWVILMLPLLLCVPLGLAAGGAFTAAVAALVAGALLVLVVVGISSLATSLLHLAVRDRRRGELLALLFILIVPAASMLPGLLHDGRRQPQGPSGHVVSRGLTIPGWVSSAGAKAFAAYPSELYASATGAAARRERGLATTGLLALAATGLFVHAVGMMAFRRILDSPGSSGARRAVPMRSLWARTLPGLTPGASAVALAQVRLALRTSRGRSILLAPVMMLVLSSVAMRRNLGGVRLGPLEVQSGLGVASFASFVCLIAILPLAMNQFAVDKAGLTRALLSPLTDREYLTGKAVGNGLIAAGPALFCVLACLIAFPGGSVALWLTLPLVLIASYLLVAPVAAILSAIFPRVVNMDGIGKGSNAHGVAALLGMLAFVAAGAVSLLIVLAAHWLAPLSLVPVVVLVWSAISWGLSVLLFIPARRIFANRRENLAMLL